MKRLIAAVSLAALAAPAVAVEAGLPYEQNVIDRALPTIQERAAAVASSGDTRSASPWASDFHFIAPPQ